MNIDSSLLFLDFDGVICDSVIECFVSSWLAYYKEHLHDQFEIINIQYKNDFISLRPFIRSGEDFLLIHELLYNSIKISSQKEFDFYIKSAGKEKMAGYKELLYEKRWELLKTSKDYWLSLNKIYKHIIDILKNFSLHKNFHILSTKKTDLILEILKSGNFKINADRVHYSGKNRKLDIISELLKISEIKNAVIIDDQIDHLINNKNLNIDVYLAEWGYIRKEWLSEPKKVKTLNVDDMQSFIS